jgi:hypothetical protein
MLRRHFAAAMTAVLIGAPAFAGLFSTSLSAEDAHQVKRLAVASTLGDTVHGRLVGLTAFQNKSFDASIPGWNLDATVTKDLVEHIVGGATGMLANVVLFVFPAASISQAFSIRRARVSDCLAGVIQWIHSLRATSVMSDHTGRVFGAAARALRRSAGTLGSGSFPTDRISSGTTSPTSAPAASRIFLFTLSQWLFLPSGSSVARKGCPLMMASTVVIPRVGSFALAFLGRIRKEWTQYRVRHRPSIAHGSPAHSMFCTR